MERDRTVRVWLSCLGILAVRSHPPARMWFYTDEGYEFIRALHWSLRRDARPEEIPDSERRKKET